MLLYGRFLCLFWHSITMLRRVALDSWSSWLHATNAEITGVTTTFSFVFHIPVTTDGLFFCVCEKGLLIGLLILLRNKNLLPLVFLPLVIGRDRCLFVAQMGHISPGSIQRHWVPVVVRSIMMSQPSYFLRPLKVYFGSKYQTGFCLQEKGRGGAGGGLKITVVPALCTISLLPQWRVSLTDSGRLYDMSVWEAETGYLGLSSQEHLPHYTLGVVPRQWGQIHNTSQKTATASWPY